MKKVVLLIVLCLPIVLYAQSSSKSKKGKIENARDAIKNEHFSHAIELYAELVNGKDSGKDDKGELMSEYAYALALSHNFDFALATLDYARMLQPKHADFYTNQILAIMGFQDIASKFEFTDIPTWLISDYKILCSSRKVTKPIVKEYIPKKELETVYNMLNQRQFVQGLVMLEKLGHAYPQAYAIPIVASLAWEGLGNTEQAVCYMEKALQMMEDKENEKTKDNYTKRLNSLKVTKCAHPKQERKGLRLMTFAGINAAKGMISLNGRVGFYTNNLFSASVNVSTSIANKQFMGSIGISGYKTWRFLMGGLGFSYQFGGGNHTFSLTPTAGLTFFSKSGKSSFDVLFNCHVPFSSNGTFTYGITIGRTFYL